MKVSSKWITVLKRVGVIFATTLVVLLAVLYFGMMILAKGPSESAGRQFVLSVRETSALKFLANFYFSEEEIQSFYQQDDDIRVYDLSEIKASVEDKTEEAAIPLQKLREGATDDPDIFIFDVKGATYVGKVMLVTDPSRMLVGTLDGYGVDVNGKQLEQFIADYDAVAGINAGGFYDRGGRGNGGIPDGVVIRDGQLIWGGRDEYFTGVMGFTADYKLIVGDMTGAEILEKGIVNGLSFDGGPVLIQNGVASKNALARSGSLNPRTAIGQRADGTIVIVVINGRNVDSLGANFKDLINIMTEYGAVTAVNLDGGSSSALFFEGNRLSATPYVVGTRNLPDAILVGKRVAQ